MGLYSQLSIYIEVFYLTSLNNKKVTVKKFCFVIKFHSLIFFIIVKTIPAVRFAITMKKGKIIKGQELVPLLVSVENVKLNKGTRGVL